MAKSKGHFRHRLQHIYDIAKTKSICEGADPADKKLDLDNEEDFSKPVSSFEHAQFVSATQPQTYFHVQLL